MFLLPLYLLEQLKISVELTIIIRGELMHATRGIPPSMDGEAFSMDEVMLVDPVPRLVEKNPRVGSKIHRWCDCLPSAVPYPPKAATRTA